MDKNVRIMKKEDFTTTDWSGGKTTQLFIYPEDSNYGDMDFDFRISSATVELEKSNFTKLPGINRFITPLDNSLKLTHDGKNYIELKPFQVYEFPGGIDTTSYGKVTDFNLMLNKGIKGRMESIEIEDEVLLSGKNIKGKFKMFYSFSGEFKFIINGENFDLNPKELLLVNLKGYNSIVDIRIKTKSKDTILKVQVDV